METLTWKAMCSTSLSSPSEACTSRNVCTPYIVYTCTSLLYDWQHAWISSAPPHTPFLRLCATLVLKLCSLSWLDGGGTGLAEHGERDCEEDDAYLAAQAAARLGARLAPPAAAIKLMKYSGLLEM